MFIFLSIIYHYTYLQINIQMCSSLPEISKQEIKKSRNRSTLQSIVLMYAKYTANCLTNNVGSNELQCSEGTGVFNEVQYSAVQYSAQATMVGHEVLNSVSAFQILHSHISTYNNKVLYSHLSENSTIV